MNTYLAPLPLKAFSINYSLGSLSGLGATGGWISSLMIGAAETRKKMAEEMKLGEKNVNFLSALFLYYHMHGRAQGKMSLTHFPHIRMIESF